MKDKDLITTIYTVTQLNNEVGALFTQHFPLIWLEGEISNFSQPKSGHMYFSLKDPTAQVRAAMFRNRNMLLNFAPNDGMQVLVRARVGLYEPRGDYQLLIEHMEETGSGKLQKAFEVLKSKLYQEGLFDDQHKKSLPRYPQQIGVITSSTGAALQDVLSVLKRRYPTGKVLIYPTAVQGAAAINEIVTNLELAKQRNDCDVLLMVRGGGSLEDLQAFNDEKVARAIAACSIPIVTGIGHEIDYTIADFVADARGVTPSAAAELASPDHKETIQQIRYYNRQLENNIFYFLSSLQDRASQLQRRLQNLHPQQRLNTQQQRLDEVEFRLFNAMQHIQYSATSKLQSLTTRLLLQSPQAKLDKFEAAYKQLQYRLHVSIKNIILHKKSTMDILLRELDSISPLATLKRGYAILSNPKTGSIITETANIAIDDTLHAKIAQGELSLKVIDKSNSDN